MHLFQHALDRLTHRGPDGGAMLKLSGPVPVLLGHRRLSIVDLTDGGRQPMTRGDLTIVFNGEIYNHIELREQLRQKGVKFQSSSDTEVLLAAFQVWGVGCLQRLNGMWAFAIWDQSQGRLFLSRDRFGEKPLFYSFQPGRFLFGSEMKALIPLMEAARPSAAFQRCVENQFGYEATGDCLIEGICRLPAGCFAIATTDDLARGRLPVQRYWETLQELVDVPEHYEDQVQEFRRLFFDSCRIRMRADVPIGTALSGGLDSASVACAMRSVAGSDPSAAPAWQSAFVATFPGSPLDESVYAAAVIEKTGITGRYLPIDPVGGLSRLERYLYLFEEVYISNPVPFMDIYRLVADNGVRVTLDGHGGDELLSGYGGFLTAMNDAFANPWYMRHVLECWTGRRPGILAVTRQMVELHKGGRGVLKFLRGRLTQLKTRCRENLRDRQLGWFNQELYRCFHQTILPTLLRNYDRYAMSAGVEIRMPFLDHRLVRFCFSLPWQSKIPRSSTYTKAILRDAMGDLLPDLVRFRRSKVGFTSPLAAWMKGPWRQYMLDHVQSRSFLECSLVTDPAGTRDSLLELLNTDVEVPQHHAERIWGQLTPWFWETFFLKPALNCT